MLCLRAWLENEEQRIEEERRRRRLKGYDRFSTWCLLILMALIVLTVCGLQEPTPEQVARYKMEKAVAGSFPWPEEMLKK